MLINPCTRVLTKVDNLHRLTMWEQTRLITWQEVTVPVQWWSRWLAIRPQTVPSTVDSHPPMVRVCTPMLKNLPTTTPHPPKKTKHKSPFYSDINVNQNRWTVVCLTVKSIRMIMIKHDRRGWCGILSKTPHAEWNSCL